MKMCEKRMRECQNNQHNKCTTENNRHTSSRNDEFQNIKNEMDSSSGSDGNTGDRGTDKNYEVKTVLDNIDNLEELGKNDIDANTADLENDRHTSSGKEEFQNIESEMDSGHGNTGDRGTDKDYELKTVLDNIDNLEELCKNNIDANTADSENDRHTSSGKEEFQNIESEMDSGHGNTGDRSTDKDYELKTVLDNIDDFEEQFNDDIVVNTADSENGSHTTSGKEELQIIENKLERSDCIDGNKKGRAADWDYELKTVFDSTDNVEEQCNDDIVVNTADSEHTSSGKDEFQNIKNEMDSSSGSDGNTGDRGTDKNYEVKTVLDNIDNLEELGKNDIDANTADLENDGHTSSGKEEFQNIESEMDSDHGNTGDRGTDKDCELKTVLDNIDIFEELCMNDIDANTADLENDRHTSSGKEEFQNIESEMDSGHGNTGDMGTDKDYELKTVLDNIDIFEELCMNDIDANTADSENDRHTSSGKEEFQNIESEMDSGHGNTGDRGTDKDYELKTVLDNIDIFEELCMNDIDANTADLENDRHTSSGKEEFQNIESEMDSGHGNTGDMGTDKDYELKTVLDNIDIFEELCMNDIDANTADSENDRHTSSGKEEFQNIESEMDSGHGNTGDRGTDKDYELKTVLDNIDNLEELCKNNIDANTADSENDRHTSSGKEEFQNIESEMDSSDSSESEFENVDDDEDFDSDFIPESNSEEDEEGNCSDIIDNQSENKKLNKSYITITKNIEPGVELDTVSNDLQKQKEQQIEKDVTSGSVKPAARKKALAENECSFDKTFPNIYTKTITKDLNEKSKFGRTYDRVHACVYCFQLFTNIATHLEYKHRKEVEVKEIFKIREQLDNAEGEDNERLKKEIHAKQFILRHKGNNLHNTKVMNFKEGEIILSRRKKMSDFNVNDYGPCPDCEEWVILENLTHHKKTCPKKDISEWSKGASILQSKIMKGKIIPYGSTTLKKEVFPSMQQDITTEVAQLDKLITALGDTWLMKNSRNKLKRKNFTSYRMRLSARLLLLLRKELKQNGSMEDFLKPVHFDLFVRCALLVCEENEHEELKNPSNAIKLGYDISRLASSKLGYAIKENNMVAKQEASDFLKLRQMEWSDKVTRMARMLLEERRFNKKTELPDPADIAALASYLVNRLNNLDITIFDKTVYREVVTLTQARLLLYNRRRPGELEAISVETYSKRSKEVSEVDRSLRQNLTKLEDTLLKSQELVEIRGKVGEKESIPALQCRRRYLNLRNKILYFPYRKMENLTPQRGKPVPLLIPQEAQRMLEFLTIRKNREMAGIKGSNPFLFANTGDGVVSAADSLENVKYRDDVGLKHPKRIFANNLRKHTATIAQVISLNDNELKSICNHLGHTQKVHDEYYRQTSGLIERIDIAKLMLIQEHNLVGKFHGRKLSDIQFDELGEIESEEKINTEEEKDNTDENVLQNDLAGILDDDDGVDQAIDRQRKCTTKVFRVKWTKEEEAEIHQHFSKYFSGKIDKMCPSRADCLTAKDLSKTNNGKIHLRKWDTLKKKVANMLQKNKKCN